MHACVRMHGTPSDSCGPRACRTAVRTSARPMLGLYEIKLIANSRSAVRAKEFSGRRSDPEGDRLVLYGVIASSRAPCCRVHLGLLRWTQKPLCGVGGVGSRWKGPAPAAFRVNLSPALYGLPAAEQIAQRALRSSATCCSKGVLPGAPKRFRGPSMPDQWPAMRSERTCACRALPSISEAQLPLQPSASCCPRNVSHFNLLQRSNEGWSPSSQ